MSNSFQFHLSNIRYYAFSIVLLYGPPQFLINSYFQKYFLVPDFILGNAVYSDSKIKTGYFLEYDLPDSLYNGKPASTVR